MPKWLRELLRSMQAEKSVALYRALAAARDARGKNS